MCMEEALSQLCASAGEGAEEALAVLSKILSNVLENPADPKFRRLSPQSTKLEKKLLCHEGALDFLGAAGFVRAADGALELPRNPAAAAAAANANRAVLRRCKPSRTLESQAAEQVAGQNAAASIYRAAVDGGAHGAGLVELEASLHQPGGIEALQLLERILTNVRRYPDSEKYRCVNLTKPAGRKVLPALPLLLVAGFKRVELPTGEDAVQLGHVHLDVIERVWAMVWWASKPEPFTELQPASGVLSHALGAVLGVAVGDALGGPLGGQEPLAVTATEVDKAMEMCGGGLWGVAPGQATANTELMVSLASALSAALPDKVFPADDVALRYGKWGQTLPFHVERACGQVFRGAMSAENMIERAKDVNAKSMGAGALVRSAPLAVFGALVGGDSQALAELARADARLSHPSLSVGGASAAYVVAAGHLIATAGDRASMFGALQHWLEVEQASSRPGSTTSGGEGLAGWTHLSRGTQAPMGQRSEERPAWLPPGERMVAMEDVARWVGKALARREEGDELLAFSDASAGALLSSEVGSVEIPLTHAFRHLRLGSSFEVAMRATLAGGGDSSTIAAVVGGLLGAAVGLEGIPQRWRRAVLSCDTSAGGQPRPLEYHPSALPVHIERICSSAAAAAARSSS